MATALRHSDHRGQRIDGKDPSCMRVILYTRDYDRWLDREEAERSQLDMLRLFESEEMEVHEANPKVGNFRNNGPEMMRAAAKATEDGERPL